MKLSLSIIISVGDAASTSVAIIIANNVTPTTTNPTIATDAANDIAIDCYWILLVLLLVLFIFTDSLVLHK